MLSTKEEQADSIKLELVEDFHLVTIPITTSLLVLFSYIVCGAAIFSAWEVREKSYKLYTE